MHLNNETILSRLWMFRRSNGEEISRVRFLDGGHLAERLSPVEQGWSWRDDALTFVDGAGAVSTRFDKVEEERGRLVLTGDFLPLGLTGHHQLREIEPLLDWGTLVESIPELVGVDEHRASFRTTERLVQTLAGLGVYLGRLVNRFSPSDLISIPRDGVLEPYSCFPLGNQLVNMGSFSYAESVLPDITVGRYCSIASGLEVFKDRHPIEWATTSSITYDFSPAFGYRSFVAAQRNFNSDAMPPSRPPRHYEAAPLVGHDVWIGQNVQLARGIRVGTGAVIAAAAVVTRDVPAYMIVGGVPARVIRPRFDQPLRERLLASEWWRHGPDLLRQADFRNPERFVETAEQWRERAPFAPRYVRASDVIAKLSHLPS